MGHGLFRHSDATAYFEPTTHEIVRDRTIELAARFVEEKNFARTGEIERNGVGKLFAYPLAIAISPRPVEESNISTLLESRKVRLIVHQHDSEPHR